MRFLQTKIIFGFIFLLLACNSPGQNSTTESIKYIRKVYAQINSQKNFEQLKLENEELTDEVPDGGVFLIGFFKDKTLLKIELWTGLSHGTFQIEYYFDKGNLVFGFVTENNFRQSGDSLDHSKIELKFEGRYYFKNDKLIHKTTKGSGFWSDSSDGVQSLLEDSKIYLQLLYSKKNNDG